MSSRCIIAVDHAVCNDEVGGRGYLESQINASQTFVCIIMLLIFDGQLIFK